MMNRLVSSSVCSRTVCGLLFLLVLVIVPKQTSAIPLSDYQKNLQRAITALDTLAQRDEEESDAGYNQRLAETINVVRQSLPEKQSIDSEDPALNVDNVWLHKLLEQLEVASESDAQSICQQLIESLKSIDERVVELQNAKSSGLSKSEAESRLASILNRSEYSSSKAQESAISRLTQRLARWIASILPQFSPLEPGKGSPFTMAAQIVVIGLALAVIAFVAFKLIKHFRGRVRPARLKKKREPRIVLGERLEPDASATDLLSDAEALARQGELRAAIRKAYIALLVELGDRKVISLAQHKTNRDYLRSVRSHPSLHNNMTGLTDRFERHWYGFAQTSVTDWQNFKADYQVALRAND
jgi:hypothetical protein